MPGHPTGTGDNPNGKKSISILIPFKLQNPKTRLSGILDPEERRELAKLMLLDVLDSIASSIHHISSKLDKIIIIVPDEETENGCKKFLEKFNNSVVEVIKDNRSLNEAINNYIDRTHKSEPDSRIAIIMADLPLLSPEIIAEFLDSGEDVVLAPGRKGGTNLLLINNLAFRVSYHHGSFMKHIEIANSLNLTHRIFDSFYAGIDIDDSSDLLELMIHGVGKRCWNFLFSKGYYVDTEQKDPIIGKKG